MFIKNKHLEMHIIPEDPEDDPVTPFLRASIKEAAELRKQGEQHVFCDPKKANPEGETK